MKQNMGTFFTLKGSSEQVIVLISWRARVTDRNTDKLHSRELGLETLNNILLTCDLSSLNLMLLLGACLLYTSDAADE